jgi:glycosyltransferase involved in cell wall biosynthesis
MPANIAIDYFPAAFSSKGPKLMGLNAANEGFASGFVRHADVDVLAAHTRTEAEFDTFAQLVRDTRGESVRARRVEPGNNAALADIGALLHPFPGFGPLAWHRRFAHPAAYSLLGITHTTATHAVMDSIGNLMVAPIEPWDAVVCTSAAVRATYETVLAQWQEHLAERLGATRFPRPQLPVIPLGVDTARFDAAPPGLRESLRSRLGIGPDDLVVFWMGRFTHLAKAHPIPSYLALQALARRTGRPVVYLQAGWFAGEGDRAAFADAASRFSPDVRHVFVDGRDAEYRQGGWQAADIFLSLSDNLQETFGLTPIEAMAAGLPVVVSDWDGYRDTVRHGIDGFRIPTTLPPAGTGRDLGFHFATGRLDYSAYCGAAGQMAAVDLGRCVEALAALAADPSLRRRMGDAGRERARTVFDWRVVIGQYQSLAAELAERRAHAVHAPAPAGGARLPLRDDPFHIFGGYATHSLGAQTALWPGGTAPAHLQELHQHALNRVGAAWRADLAAIGRLRQVVQARPGITLGTLAQGLPAAQQLVLVRSVAWMLKMDLLSSNAPRTVPGPAPAGPA